MRKIIISILLASAAAAPAVAGPRDAEDRQQAREQRQEARENAREERAQERAERVERAERAPQFQGRVEARGQFDGAAEARARGAAQQRDLNQIRAQRDAARDAARDQRIDRRDERRERVLDARDLRQSSRQAPPVFRGRVPVVSNTPQPGTQPPLRVERRHSGSPNWNTKWRHDNRYDWQKWRRHHRWLYNLGYYYDPYGWNYSPFQIGWRLWPSYYSNRYWINDPWQYRLPYAPAGMRWVRYWDDAVLVDTWSGEVVDVIYNFFW